MGRSGTNFGVVVCLAVLLAGGCSKAPLGVRFPRHVDEARLDALPRVGGSVLLLIDVAFWTSQEHMRRIPVARREKTFIIGPGAAQMAEQMLLRMFDEVERARRLDRVEDLDRFDHVIHLVHDSFDDLNIFLVLGSRQRYRVGLGAEVSRPDGTEEGSVHGVGKGAFWFLGLGEPVEGDDRLARRAGETLNRAVQASLFQMMDQLVALLGPPSDPG